MSHIEPKISSGFSLFGESVMAIYRKILLIIILAKSI